MVDYEHAYSGATDYFGGSPNRFMMEHIELIREGGSVLDVGVGQGRNALPLARRGLRVTGIDMSAAAIETTEKRAAELGLAVSLKRCSFVDFDSGDAPFDAVLAFGLLQEFERQDHARLLDKVWEWTAPGSLLLLTAWHVDDPRYEQLSRSSAQLGRHSFRTSAGAVRTYLERNEILKLLAPWEIVHHFEGLTDWHRHGDGEPEQHGAIEVVARRTLPTS